MTIEVKLKNNRSVELSDVIIGKTFENEATILLFELTKEMADKDFYIEFEKPDKKKVSTPKLEVKVLSKKAFVEYAIPNSLLDLKGDLKAEVVLRNSSGLVYKSYTMRFNILSSINALDDMPQKYPDFVSEAQKVLDVIETTGDGTKYLSDDGSYKEFYGSDGGGGPSSYEQLTSKPQINSVELVKNKSFEDLGMVEITNTELNEIFGDL